MLVHWYAADSLSYRNIEEPMLERGVNVDHLLSCLLFSIKASANIFNNLLYRTPKNVHLHYSRVQHYQEVRSISSKIS